MVQIKDKPLPEPMVAHFIGVCIMMTSSNGNIFRVTGHFCGEFHKGQWRGALMFSSPDLRLDKQLSKYCEAGDLRRYRAHYDVIVMV